jgi:P2 family phage major capsid protein
MRNETRLKYNAFAAAIATLNGVDDATKSFSVSPSVQQTLETRIQQSSEFLTKINMVPVQDQEGEKLGLGVIGTIAGRSAGQRTPRSLADLTSGKYRCVQTNFDSGIPYAQLDAWAKFKDFQTKLRDVIIKQQALDRMMIGFNVYLLPTPPTATPTPAARREQGLAAAVPRQRAGTRAERNQSGQRQDQVGASVDKADGYKTLDALAYDAINGLIHEAMAEHPELVVIVGRDLLADKYFPVLNKDQAPSEQVAADMVISQKRIGGRPAVSVPFFPAGKMLITTLSNLSLYYQEGARRRYLREEPDWNRVANYESSNDAYVVESYEAGCLIENIQMVS